VIRGELFQSCNSGEKPTVVASIRYALRCPPCAAAVSRNNTTEFANLKVWERHERSSYVVFLPWRKDTPDTTKGVVFLPGEKTTPAAPPLATFTRKPSQHGWQT
jgi:hypothetical protein